MFGLLLAATLLPVALFVWMGMQLLDQESHRRQELRAIEANRQHAVQLQQRLDAAAALLATLADSPGYRDPAAIPPQAGAALAALLRLGPQGQVLAGQDSLRLSWAQARSAIEPGGGDIAGLAWLPALDTRAPARILIRYVARDGHIWLAEVLPAFVWPSAAEQATPALHCVTDTLDRRLHCPDPAWSASGPIADSQRAPGFVRRELVLSSGARWLIGTQPDPAGSAEPASPVLWRWTLVGALATLLLAGLLGWWQFRRTAATLSALIDGTRRLAAQDWSARVELPAGDEFARLGQSLNLMAERLGQQMQAMQIQSAIDREILGGLDTARVMALVVRRLEALLPQASVAVVVTGDGRSEWRSYRPFADPLRLPAPPELPILPERQFAFWCSGEEAVPVWAAHALGTRRGSLKTLCWVPAVWQGQMLALLVMGGCHEWELTEEARREIGELRDRTAVTLAAAARESALLERAVQDGLTGLLNRNGLHDAIDRSLVRTDPFTLVLVDLDRFKEVNDTLGHQAGDELLCAVAGRLRRCVGPGAVISRPGGDEFVLLLPGAPDDATAAALAICAELAKPFALRGVLQQIGGSVGLAAYPQHGDTRVELMRRADMAMYAAKSEGRGRLSWYEAALDERLAHRAWMAHELRRALDQTQFELYFQPRVDAVSASIVCAEVLVRWHHPERGMIMPTEFVTAAEETGLIDRLGHWVMSAALCQMSEWRARGVALKRIAINVSPRQLKAPGFADTVLDLLARHQLTGDDIEIELTENLFAGDVDAVILALAPLRNAGVLVALDDFGTGYSSLASLYRLPVDVIKIDRSFVSDLGKRASADAVARSIVALAKALRKRVVAEGVETRAQRDHLLHLDCDELQGYLYAQPMPAAALETRLTGGTAAPAAAPAAVLPTRAALRVNA